MGTCDVCEKAVNCCRRCTTSRACARRASHANAARVTRNAALRRIAQILAWDTRICADGERQEGWGVKSGVGARSGDVASKGM